MIDEIRIYNRALVDADVTALYQQGNQPSNPRDILGGFLDLNDSSFDYANNQIKLKFTVPPEQLGNYFNEDILLDKNASGTEWVTWTLADIQAKLQISNPITLGFNDFSLKAHPDMLFSLQFRSKNLLGQVSTTAAFQGIYDMVRNFAGKALLNSRTVAQTKPTSNKVCSTVQGIKTPCNNFFNSTEDGTNPFNVAVARNTLTHRLLDFDQIAPVPAINRKWENTLYGKAPQGDNGRIPLLLVHGWQGGNDLRNPAKLALLEESAELQYWRHFLDYYLATPELQTKYHVYLYHYPTYKHVTYNASILTTMLKELATKKPVSDLNVAMQTEGAGVVVLAHSMGGLVTRSAIEEYHAFGANAEKLRRLITLDTPHHGSPAANPSWAGYLVKDLHTQGSADIQWDNFDSLYTKTNVGGASIPSGGAAPVSSALWYVHNPLDSKATPFPLNGSDNESAFFSACNLKSNWDETQWFGGYSSPVTLSILIPDFYTHFVETCGNSILISKSDTLSASNPNHPLGFQMRIFWDYDHETMVNGAYWGQGVFSKKAGGWDKYIGKPPYIINGDTSGDSGFFKGVTNQWVSGLVRDNYIAKAVGYKQNNENLTWSFNSPANYNPLKLEPLFNVLQGDLMREADSQ